MTETNVIHVLTRFQRGGTERDLAEVMAWELEAGLRVHLAFGQESDVSGLTPRILFHRQPHLVREISFARDIRAVAGLRTLIRATGAKVVHTHQAKAGIVGRSAAFRQRVATVHWVHGPSFGQGYPTALSVLYRKAEEMADQLTSNWVFVGEELQRVYIDAGVCEPRTSTIVRSPIDVDGLVGLRALPIGEKRRLKAGFGVDPHRPILANVGAMEWRKRHDLFLRAVALLASPKPYVLLAGDGPEQSQLRRLCDYLGIESTVVFLGHVDDVTEVLAVSDVLVHASEREGAPQVIIQALAAGLPVVATHSCGLHEVPGAAVTVAAANPVSMSAAIEGTLLHSSSPAPASSFREWQPAARRDALVDLYAGLL